jgi:hypothetical protein
MSEERRPGMMGWKIIVVSAVGAIVSIGLCQVGFYLGRNVHDGAPTWLDTIGGLAFLASILGVFVGIVVATIEAISRLSKPKDDQ